MNAIRFGLITIFLIILASCGSENEQPTPTPKLSYVAIAHDIRFDVVNISLGEPQNDGWRSVSIRFSAENLTDFVIVSPLLCGNIIDTGGYTRELKSDELDGIYLSQVFLIPHIRNKEIVLRTKIPQNQQIQSMTLFPGKVRDNIFLDCSNYSGNLWQFDLLAELSPVLLPFEQAPSNFNSTDGFLEYSEPKLYRIRLSNFEIYPSPNNSDFFDFEFDYEAENLGGYDFAFGDTVFVPLLVGVDNHGRQFESDDISSLKKIGPGLRLSEHMSISVPRKQKFTDSQWFYLTLVVAGEAGNTRKIGAQTKVEIKDSPLTSQSIDQLVTIEIWSGFRCAPCLQWYQEIKPKLAVDYLNSGKVKLEFHHFHYANSLANLAALASECANAQKKFWDYADQLYEAESQGDNEFNKDELLKFATNLGLDIEEFTQCLDSKQFQNIIDDSFSQALTLGLNAIPSVRINGRLLEKAFDYEIYKSMIDEALLSSPINH